MSEEFEDLDGIGSLSNKNLPNATAVLVLGILSIVTCWIYGVIGIILGIIALSLHKKDKELYASDTAGYGNSFKNSQAGKICAIIGLSLSALFLIYIIFVIAFVAGNESLFREILRNR